MYDGGKYVHEAIFVFTLASCFYGGVGVTSVGEPDITGMGI